PSLPPAGARGRVLRCSCFGTASIHGAAGSPPGVGASSLHVAARQFLQRLPLRPLTQVPVGAIDFYLRSMTMQHHTNNVAVPLLMLLLNFTALHAHGQP